MAMVFITTPYSSRSTVIGLLLVSSFLPVQAAFGTTKPSEPKPSVCTASEPVVDETSDIFAVVSYKSAIAQLFANKEFVKLDCIADTARTSKAHFAGGRWKLNVFYWAIAEPDGHATEEDWSAHLRILNRWVEAKPQSITARIALANAYTSYAWYARGSDVSNTVTDSGWKLLGQRIAKAKQVLEQASRLKTKCPEWYVVMQTVALAENWDLTRATALLDQAVQFEPDYYYYYRDHANYLKPQWNGADGDAERFAEEAADRVGGVKGDILYFQIATELICRCSGETTLKLMSWPRIQRGVAELEKENGPSATNLNLLTYMAIKENDSVVAHKLFSRIEDNWDQETWRTRSYFDRSKGWAEQMAAYVESPGQQVVELAKTKFAPALRQCIETLGGDVAKFDLILTVEKEGTVSEAFPNPQNKAASCLGKLKGEMLLPPPRAPYRFRIEVDPAELLSASGR
jgi:hypothetical protein